VSWTGSVIKYEKNALRVTRKKIKPVKIIIN
jgi:hypothetical protein